MARTEAEMRRLYERHVDTVYRVCFLYMKQHTMDLEDAVQNTFIKLMRSEKAFENQEHEKAWLIVAAGSVCKNMLKSAWKSKVMLSNTIEPVQSKSHETDETLRCVMMLPNQYKAAIYLHYYEGYSGKEIAAYLEKRESTVWTYLHKGRKLLKKMLKEDETNA